MDRKLAAQLAVGAAGTIAANRLANRPELAVLATIAIGASTIYASHQPDVALVLALATIVVLIAATH